MGREKCIVTKRHGGGTEAARPQKDSLVETPRGMQGEDEGPWGSSTILDDEREKENERGRTFRKRLRYLGRLRVSSSSRVSR